MIRRRQFITGLGSAAAWPVVARAQKAERMRRVGVLSGYATDDVEGKARVTAFRQGMQERGWTEGRNLQIEYCWAGPNTERITSCAAELVDASPEVILAITSPSVAAMQNVNRTIPIIFAGISDPVLSRATACGVSACSCQSTKTIPWRRLASYCSRRHLRTWVGPMAATCGWTFVGPALTPIGYERSCRSWSACNPTSSWQSGPRQPLPSSGGDADDPDRLYERERPRRQRHRPTARPPER
jgi:hypothetical protein